MAKITLSPEARKLVGSLRARIAELESENESLRTRRAGIRSDGVEDKYTSMEASELRGEVIKRGGDPDEIVHGFHSRQRSIKMREWLRAHPAKKATAKADTKKPARAKVKEEPAPKRKPKVAAKVATKPKRKRSM